MSLLVIFAALAIGVSIPLAWWALSGPRSPSDAAAKNLAMGINPSTNMRETRLALSASQRVISPMNAKFAERGRRITPAGMRESLERRIQLAGLQDTWPAERVYATKALCGGVGVIVAAFLIFSSPTGLVIIASVTIAAILYFAPDLLLHSRGADRQGLIQKQLADVLDQITVCVEAGLSFDGAVQRVTATGSGPLPDELGRSLQDIQLGTSRAISLERLLDRTNVKDLRTFVHTFNQAERFGIPVAQILRVQSSEIRLKRRQYAEEQAMKLPIKLVFPTVLFILPALFVVVAGPAAIRAVEAFSQS